MDSFEKCKENSPSKDKFQNSLTKYEISDKNKEHAVNVWKTFKKNGKDDHDLYLKCDVLSLSVKSFRIEPKNSIELDSANQF